MKIFEIEIFYDDRTVASVKSILGTYFSRLEKFFEKSFFNFEDNVSTILVTRRCFLLATWFLGYLRKREDLAALYEISEAGSCLCIKNRSIKKSNYVLSDKGISLLRTINTIKEIHVLDDICIHGRQLDRIKNHVQKMSGVPQEKVKKIVFMSSKESLVKKVEAEEETVKGEWVLLSQRVVEAINYLVLPYVAYLNSYVATGITLSEHEAFVRGLYNREDLLIKRFGEKDRLLLGKESFYIVEKGRMAQESKTLYCVRYYYNIETGVASFIPYVVLAPLDGKLDEDRVRSILNGYLLDSATEILLKKINVVIKDDYENEKGFIYNLISCVASQYYGITFANKFTSEKFNYVKDWASDICGCTLMAFGAEIANIIKGKKNYRTAIYVAESCAALELQDLHAAVDEFMRERWAQREIAAVERKIDPPKRTLFSLIDTEINARIGIHEDKSKAFIRNLIAYSYLCSVIDACDIGRQNIASQSDSANSYLEVGELGVMTVRSNKSNIAGELNKLLSLPYYYYILC